MRALLATVWVCGIGALLAIAPGPTSIVLILVGITGFALTWHHLSTWALHDGDLRDWWRILTREKR